MIIDLAVISLTMSLISLLLILFSDIFGKRYKAKYRYIAWLIVALRLLVPVRFDFDTAPITFQEPDILSKPIAQAPENSDDITHLPHYEPSGEIYEGAEIYIPSEKTHEKQDKAYVLSVAQILTIVWSAGVVVFLSYHLIVLAAFNFKVKKRIVHLKDNIYKTTLIESPMMTGFFKKRILIPDIQLSDRELELILLHENAHARRGDIWYKLILVCANAMHWFNPIVYLMTHRANRDLEYSCDDLVTKGMTAEEKKEYSLTLLRFMHKNTKKEEKI